MVGVLWGFEPFSLRNHHIRAYMHHVCLIQSISARKAAHIKLGTHSVSSQCQLHFGTKMVSIGWSGCEWLPSECKNARFQAFPPLVPSGILFHLNYSILVQWVIWYEEFVVKIGLHATANKAHAPNCKLQILHLWTDSYYVKCGACQFGGPLSQRAYKNLPILGLS